MLDTTLPPELLKLNPELVTVGAQVELSYKVLLLKAKTRLLLTTRYWRATFLMKAFFLALWNQRLQEYQDIVRLGKYSSQPAKYSHPFVREVMLRFHKTIETMMLKNIIEFFYGSSPEMYTVKVSFS